MSAWPVLLAMSVTAACVFIALFLRSWSLTHAPLQLGIAAVLVLTIAGVMALSAVGLHTWPVLVAPVVELYLVGLVAHWLPGDQHFKLIRDGATAANLTGVVAWLLAASVALSLAGVLAVVALARP